MYICVYNHIIVIWRLQFRSINTRWRCLISWPAGTSLSSRWWMWAAVSWWTGCRTTSRVRLSTTSWTSTCTLTPSTCVDTERATTMWRAASEATLSFLPVGNRCDISSFSFMILSLWTTKPESTGNPLKAFLRDDTCVVIRCTALW